jgi:hypothetical protein
MGLGTHTPWGMAQGNTMLVIGRRLYVLVLSGVLVLAPSTLYGLLPIGYSHFINKLLKMPPHGQKCRLCFAHIQIGHILRPKLP